MIGEKTDPIYTCNDCGHAFNEDTVDDPNGCICPKCYGGDVAYNPTIPSSNKAVEETTLFGHANNDALKCLCCKNGNLINHAYYECSKCNNIIYPDHTQQQGLVSIESVIDIINDKVSACEFASKDKLANQYKLCSLGFTKDVLNKILEELKTLKQ